MNPNFFCKKFDSFQLLYFAGTHICFVTDVEKWVCKSWGRRRAVKGTLSNVTQHVIIMTYCNIFSQQA